MTIGYIGLGKMGKNMVLRLLEQGIDIVAWNRSPDPLNEVVGHGARAAQSIADLTAKLQSPRIIWLMLPAGNVTDDVLKKLLPHLDQGDLIVDGGNSFWKDSIRRAKLLKTKGVHFMDVGVSGGPEGARSGACLMIGGDDSDYDMLFPVIRAATNREAFAHIGPVGSGHFVKMIHNGIEYGMMEAIAEGAAILAKGPFPLDLATVFRIYNNRSVIESRLIGWTEEALSENPNLDHVSSTIDMTGEGEWTAKTATELGIEAPVISASIKVRKASSKEPTSFRNRVVTALRGKFGHHKVAK